MARKRLIAPQFFTHGPLFEAEVETGLPIRVAFAGLWTQADRRGLFEWKPMQLKLAILPFDSGTVSAPGQHGAGTVLAPSEYMAKVLSVLCSYDFVEYYEVDGKPYGRIPNFKKWQSFHKDERPNLHIPEPLSSAPPSSTPPQHRASTVPVHGQHGASTPITVTSTITSTNRLASADAPPPLSLVSESEPSPKLERRRKPRVAPEAKYPSFPDATCREMYRLWTGRMGAVEYGRFRKLFAPCFSTVEAERTPDMPTDAELCDALRSFVDLAPRGRGAPWAKVTVCAELLSAIALRRRDLAENPEARLDAVMQIIHGRKAS
jgi:hypothetical protein